MQIIRINQNQNALTFKSGLTSELLNQEKCINPKIIENYFINKSQKDFGGFYNIDLKGNKAHALANRVLADIFLLFRKKHDYRNGYSMQNIVTPQDIYVFEENEKFKMPHNAFFTIVDDIKAMEEKPLFQSSTIFITNSIKTLEEMNEITDYYYRENKMSSSHFLQPYIHEWLHAIQNKIIKNYCANHNYSYEATINNFESLKLSAKEKEVVSDVVGLYPTLTTTYEYGELFAESWSKFICESLSSNCKKFIKDPLELLNRTPKEFQEILKKVSNIKFIRI